jgi:hypothetical protein
MTAPNHDDDAGRRGGQDHQAPTVEDGEDDVVRGDG